LSPFIFHFSPKSIFLPGHFRLLFLAGNWEHLTWDSVDDGIAAGVRQLSI
jgi:hypothetical protein